MCVGQSREGKLYPFWLLMMTHVFMANSTGRRCQNVCMPLVGSDFFLCDAAMPLGGREFWCWLSLQGQTVLVLHTGRA